MYPKCPRLEGNIFVSKARYRYAHTTGKGIQVKYLCIPSHTDPQEHNKFDTLAKLSIKRLLNTILGCQTKV